MPRAQSRKQDASGLCVALESWEEQTWQLLRS
jgi:hypothetical protein